MRVVILLAVLCLGLSGMVLAETLPIIKFGGIDADDDPLILTAESGKTPDSQNGNTDEGSGFSPRKGFVSFSTQTGNNQWVFPLTNGTRYFITQSSNNLMATTGGTNFNIFVATVEPSVVTVGVALGNKFFFSNSSSGLRDWDTSVVTIDSPALTFTQLAVSKGRLWGTGIAGDARTVYGSEYLNGRNFQLAVNPVETDPVRIQVQGALDEILTGFYASFKDKLIWFKAHSFGAITGSRRSNFQSQSFSENVGCAYMDSIRDCDGLLRFLGPNRIVYEFDGSILKKISEDIDNLMSTVVQGDLNNRVWTQDTQGDWSAGVSGPYISSNTSPGDLVFTHDSDPYDQWVDGTPGACDYASSPTWTVLNASYTFVSGCKGLIAGGTPGFDPFPPYGNRMYTESTLTNATWYIKIGSIGDQNKLPSTKEHFYCFVCLGADPYYSTGYRVRISTDGPNTRVYQLISGSLSGTVLISSSVHKDVDSGAGWPIVTRDPSGNFRLYRYKSCVGCAAPALLGTASDTNYLTSNNFVFGINSGPDGYGHGANLSDWQLASIITEYTGRIVSTFTSQSFNVGNKITSWGPFSADTHLNGGNITYGIYADTNANFLPYDDTTYIASQTITSGSVPSIVISTYVGVAAFFNRTANTQNPTLNDFTVSWNEGSVLRTASYWVNQRYWLGCAISSSANNTILVYDKNHEWQKYVGINMDASVIYNGLPYFVNTLGTFQAESGTTDNGTAITAYYKTKRFVPTGTDYFSVFDDLYVTANNSGDTLQTQFYVDGVNSPYNLANYVMNSKSGVQNVRLPFSTTALQQGKMIEFLFTVAGTTQWRLLAADLNYHKEKETAGN